jgi:hypothetical protein
LFPILEFAFAGKVWIMDLLREGVVYWVVKGYWCTWYHSLLIASYIIPLAGGPIYQNVVRLTMRPDPVPCTI